MKKVLTICTMVFVLVGLVVAAPLAKTPVAPVTEVSVSPVSTAGNPELAAKLEIQSLMAEITAAKAAGQTPDPALVARLNELQPAERTGGTLDQGGDTWASATVIPTVPYADSGTLTGAADDCVGRPYQDVFYTYTVTTAGSHTFDMCGSFGDTYLMVWKNATGACTGGTTYTADDECGGADPTLTLTLALGDVVMIECGFYYTDGTGAAYNLNVSGPTPPPPGDVCGTAIPISSFPYSVTGQTTNGFTNDYAPACMSYYGTGRDVVYTFTLSAVTTIRIDLTNTGSYAYPGVGLFAGCPDVGTCVAYASASTGDLHIPCTLLDPGQYFILVDNWPTPNFINYDLAVSVCQPCDAPPNNDCVNALPIVVNGEPICATTECATMDCAANLSIPEIWYMFETTECMDLAVAYCGTTTSGSLLADLFLGSCCGTDIGYSSYEYTSCADGLITLHFNALQPGTYWLPVGFVPAGPFCVQVTGTPCPPPFVCHCTDPMDGRWCNTVGGPINDVSVNDFLITVPIEYHITDVNVCFDGTHTYDGDVEIRLTSPNGTTVVLVDNRGGGGDNWTCTGLDDEATTPVVAGIAPFNGVFIPDFALSGFDGENAVGNWTFTMEDQAGGDFGFLNWVCLTFEYDQILAVELGAFDAIAGDRSVELQWTTASETNNDRFEIVRDGNLVAQIATQGNGATEHHYTWVDRNLANGTTYTYTLVSVDLNGVREELVTKSATPSAGLAVITEYALHQNYPNPFNPETQITYDLVDNGLVSLRVYNLMGQEVAGLVNGMADAGRHTISFDAASLPSGIYVYTLKANGFTAQKKMLLVK